MNYSFTKKNDTIIASAVVNNEFPEEYEKINWLIKAETHEITAIHTFAINTDFMGFGIGKKIFNEIKENSLKRNQKTIRIDVINENEGAHKVFTKLGFEYVDTVETFHYAVGVEKFHLYEFPLKKSK